MDFNWKKYEELKRPAIVYSQELEFHNDRMLNNKKSFMGSEYIYQSTVEKKLSSSNSSGDDSD